MAETVHESIMVAEVLNYLQAQNGGTFLDCTLGGGGHSEAILKANPENRVFALDRDKRAIERSNKRLADYQDRFFATHGSFKDLPESFFQVPFDGIFADLGISSDQLAENRGFSFNDNSKLDMRMDESAELTAEEIVNEYPHNKLFGVLKRGGVGNEASKIANQILASRPVNSSLELADIVHKVCGQYSYGSKRKNSATVVFQAIRMEVNQELREIESLLDYVEEKLKTGGRFVALCFHSLEDKLVARRIRKWGSGDEYSASWAGPQTEAKAALGQVLTRKALLPDSAEIDKNPRSRSARLRAFEFNSSGGE